MAKKIAKILNFKGKLKNNLNKPDGVRSKLMSSKLSNKYGWKVRVNLDDGLKKQLIGLLDQKTNLITYNIHQSQIFFISNRNFVFIRFIFSNGKILKSRLILVLFEVFILLPCDTYFH